jgi:transcriptional regulator with XRE-family HTH domain
MLNFGYMEGDRKKLSDYVRRVLAELRLQGVSQEEVAERSKKAGTAKSVTQGYISQIVSGTSTNLSLDKLEGLAVGLGVPLKELLRVASEGGWPETDEEFQESALHLLHQKARTADPELKQLVALTIEMLTDRIDKARAEKARSQPDHEQSDHGQA